MRRIVVLTLIALVLTTASAFVPILPITEDYVSQDIAEADPPDLGFPTIWMPPYINMTLAAEADESTDSIPEFAETLDDDIMWPMDLDRNVTEWYLNDWDDHVAINIISGGQIGGGGGDNPTAIKSLVDPPSASWCTIDMNQQTGHLNLTFELPQANLDSYEPVYFQIYLKSLFAQSSSSLSILDYNADTWETLRSDTITTSWVYWNHWIDTDAKYHEVDGSGNWEYKFRVYDDGGGSDAYFYIEWASLQFIPQTGSGYAESFADVSEWVSYGLEAGDGDTFTSDGDLVAIEANNNGNENEYDGGTDSSMSLSAGIYLEIYSRLNHTGIDKFYLFLWEQDAATGDRQVVTLPKTTSWNSYKILTTGVIESITLTVKTDSGHNPVKAESDYLRVGPATEMGFQHDCSTLTGTSTDNDVDFNYVDEILDNDVRSCSAITTASTPQWADFMFDWDITATESDIERDYYSFVEFRWRCTTYIAGTAALYVSINVDGKRYTPAGGYRYSTFDWVTERYNMMPATTVSTNKYIDFIVYTDAVGEGAAFEVEWVNFYSIANWTVSQSASCTTNDLWYVEDGVLYGEQDSGVHIGLNYDPAISVAQATYNVWNITTSDLGYSFSFRLANPSWNQFEDEETRGLVPSGTVTDVAFYTYVDTEISEITFWDDHVAPTISTFTNTPLDPNMASAVTIESIASDGASIYTVEATAVVEPSGSSIGTVTMALDYTTQAGAGIYSHTFSAGDLSEGRYTFELEVDDVANQDYEYLTFTVGADTQTTYIRIFDSLGDFVPFETFEVYKNGTRQYTDTFEGNTEYAYQIQVKDRWGESLNTTTFAAGDQELVVTVEVYSLKVMSWHYDFVRFNVTRAGLTYSEILTPLEVINFRLYTNTYDWAIDYLNGTSTSGDITLTNSTALIVTGSTISDVFSLVTTVNTMTTAINITTTTIQDNTVTIQLMFDWSNTTLYNQSINIIAAFNWENTTLYNQTISIASLFNATNTVLYDQIILIQNMFDWENTTLYNQTISILNAFNATNTVIYTQTVSILADISNMNSTIYAQTVQMLLDLENSNSTLYTQTVSLLANIANIDSDIVAQTVTILADIENVNSTIYAQTVQVLTDISNMNSTIYSQTVMILNNLSDLNATVYLVDDPTHLNPLVLGYSLSDDYCDLTIVTNWHNASISVYDNDVLRTGPTSELLCPIRYPLLDTAGTHNLSVFVDGSNDSFWYNISYTVAEIVAFELEDWHVTPQLGVENYLECFFRTTWGNSTIYVYLNNSLQTSILEQEGGISFGFWMTGISGLHNYVFNVTSGTNIITITWDYYLPDWADTGLVVRWDMWTFQDNYTLIMLESNWMNCTYYVYLNGSLVATSYNDPVTLNFTRAMNEGTYNLTIHAYGGNSNYTIKNIRYIVTEEGVSYDFSTVTGGVTYAEGDITYEGDNVVIHENPTGMFIDQATAAIVSVGGFLIIFTAFLVAREIRKKDQEKTERMYS